MATKQEVQGLAKNIDTFLGDLGTRLAEKRRKDAVQKVMGDVQNIKLTDEQGNPRPQTELMSEYSKHSSILEQLGEKDLASMVQNQFVTNVHSMTLAATMKKNLATNVVGNAMYKAPEVQEAIKGVPPEYIGSTEYIPKQYKPEGIKPVFSFRVVNMKGPGDTGTIKYVKEYKGDKPIVIGDKTIQPGDVIPIDESEYSQGVRRSSNYSFVAHDESFVPAVLTIDGVKQSGFVGTKGTLMDTNRNKINKKGVDVEYKVGTGTEEGMDISKQKMQQSADRYETADYYKQLNTIPAKDPMGSGYLFREDVNNWVKYDITPEWFGKAYTDEDVDGMYARMVEAANHLKYGD